MRYVKSYLGAFLSLMLLAASALPAQAQKPKESVPAHADPQTLQSEIRSCEAQVQTAGDAVSRVKHQQDLCQKYIKAEDFDAALRCASMIQRTPGADAECRAAHHFLMAQIYAMKMNASPSFAVMEQNRERAIDTAEEVLRQDYPDKWMINKAARNLLTNLQDPKELMRVQSRVQKRQGAGVGESQMAAAQAQSMTIEQSVGEEPKRKLLGLKLPSRPAFLGGKRTASTVATIVSSSSSRNGQQPSTASTSEETERIRRQASEIVIADSVNRSAASRAVNIKEGVLKSPIIIDGATIREAAIEDTPAGTDVGAERVVVPPSTRDRTNPFSGSAPSVSQQQTQPEIKPVPDPDTYSADASRLSRVDETSTRFTWPFRKNSTHNP